MLTGCSRTSLFEVAPTVHYPGRREGHLIRDQAPLPDPARDLTTDVAILGSGIAGLTAAWKLSKEGHRRFILLSGPEYGGNASGGMMGEIGFPRGAHYLPIPTLESIHIREMLTDLGVITADAQSRQPYFDETAVLHGPEERLLIHGKWQDGLVPSVGVPPNEREEIQRFFRYTETLKSARGADGKLAFTIPTALSSSDAQWQALDRITFKQWLQDNGFHGAALHWYADYVCRDDYGAHSDAVSAWAGLHYFASRTGHGRNTADSAVLTWSDGLQSLVGKLTRAIDRRMTPSNPWRQAGFARRVLARASEVEVLAQGLAAQDNNTFRIRAKRVIVATPLLVAARIVDGIAALGFDGAARMPRYAPWVVSNFLLEGFPREQPGEGLAWDNVVYGGKGLGYVVATHQDIRLAPPGRTIFSAYHAFAAQTPAAAREWLNEATADELYRLATCDLNEAYGRQLRRYAKALDVTVRAHAMAVPELGFLRSPGRQRLRDLDGRILFAHSDLSGLSLCEEASWWGYQAARRILREI